MWIQREISSILPQIMSEQPVLVLTGSRQVGKTALLTHIAPTASFQVVCAARGKHTKSDGKITIRGSIDFSDLT